MNNTIQKHETCIKLLAAIDLYYNKLERQQGLIKYNNSIYQGNLKVLLLHKIEIFEKVILRLKQRYTNILINLIDN